MAKFGGLPWDCVLSSEMFGRYKPDPRVYAGAARLLGLAPDEVGMVAAHGHDLLGAQAAGLRTIFVPRPDEYGSGKAFKPPESIDKFDVVADGFVELANRLNAWTLTGPLENSTASFLADASARNAFTQSAAS